MEAEEIKTILVTAAKEIVAKTGLRGNIWCDAYNDNGNGHGSVGSFCMRDGRCTEFHPAGNFAKASEPALLVKLTLTDEQGEFRRAVVRDQGYWQLAR